MMTLFNVGVGIGFAILALIPFLFMKKRWHFLSIFAITIGFGLVGYMLSKNYIYPKYLGWEFEQQMRKQPLFALIEKHHPQEFKEFIEKVKVSLNRHEGLDKIAAYSTDLTNRIFYQHLQTAPDGAIYQYLKSTLDLYRYLFVADPRAVVKLESGDDSIPVDLPAFWEEKAFQSLLNQVLQAKQKVIEESINTPATVPTEDATTPILNTILDELIGKYGKDVVRSVFTPTSAKIPPKLAAAVIIDFYAGIVGAGEEKAGIVMRRIASLKNQNTTNPNLSLPEPPVAPQPNGELPAQPAEVAPLEPQGLTPPKPEPLVPPAPPQPNGDLPPKPDNMPAPPSPEALTPPKPNGVPLPSGDLPPAKPDLVPPPKMDEPALPQSGVEPSSTEPAAPTDPLKNPKEMDPPKLPKGVELPKPAKEVALPKSTKEIKTP